MIDINQILESVFTVFGSFLLVAIFGFLGFVGGKRLVGQNGWNRIKSTVAGLAFALAVVGVFLLIGGGTRSFIDYIFTLNGFISSLIIFLVPFFFGLFAGKGDK